MRCRIEKLLWPAGFENTALFHEDHRVRHFTGKADLMGYDDKRGARARKLLDDIQHFTNQFRVER